MQLNITQDYTLLDFPVSLILFYKKNIYVNFYIVLLLL